VGFTNNFFFLRVFIFIQKYTCISTMGVVKQKPFITSTRYTMSITDIHCKTCVVCKISLFYHFIIFIYNFMCYYYFFLFICTCDFGVDSTRKNWGLSPRKPVPICPVGPCVLHPEMLGLILTLVLNRWCI